MVDFAKLLNSRQSTREIDPLKIFDSLDRKTTHATLRPAQELALAELHKRRAERDLVLKMPTGLGKSTVGLLFLQSHMAESGRGAVFLCPTVQLVRQTLQEAQRLGVRAFEYPGGERHPNTDCVAGRAVTVCTYDKLFNARSTFERGDVAFEPEAIVCDDAHAGVEEILNAFTVRISTGPLFDALRLMFFEACRGSGPSQWDDVLAGHPEVAVEVPHWIWHTLQPSVRESLQANANDQQLKFTWTRVRDNLERTRVVVSAAAVEITPILPFVDDVAPFARARHRLFASATLADDSILVRTLGCTASAARAPVCAGTDSPPGERLVLAPSLIDPSLDRSWVIRWAAGIARNHSVVALCPSTKVAKDWQSAGAELAQSDTVEDIVARLRAGSVKFAVFAQRYDGVDLPDDACRVLILDGMPHGESATDVRDRSRLKNIGGPRGRMMYRIEQGLGRAVRSPADFAVAVLAGPELATFVSNVDVVKSFGKDLQLQLDVAHELAKLAQEDQRSPSDAFESVVQPLLRRDTHWRRYYDERVRAQLKQLRTTPTESLIAIAERERQALASATAGDIVSAIRALTDAISLAESDEKRADLLESKSRYLYAQDPGESLRLQAAAFTASRTVTRPPTGTVVRPATQHDACTRLLDRLRRHTSGNGFIAEFDVLRPSLRFDVPAARFEAALQGLGSFLGADSRRPESEDHEGPDNLWLWNDLAIVIEAKNEAAYSLIPKKDAEQLLHSVEWYRNQGLGAQDPRALFFGPTTRYDNGVHGPTGARVVRELELAKLVDAVANFVGRLASRCAADWTNSEVNKLLADHGLNGAQLINRFTVAVE